MSCSVVIFIFIRFPVRDLKLYKIYSYAVIQTVYIKDNTPSAKCGCRELTHKYERIAMPILAFPLFSLALPIVPNKIIQLPTTLAKWRHYTYLFKRLHRMALSTF